MVAITHSTRTARTRTVDPIRSGETPTAATFRRRRLVAAGLAVLLLVSSVNVAFQIAGGGATTGDDGVRPVAELSVLVEPGDTVWSIADSLAGDDDVRPVVDAIVDANGNANLTTGERLRIVLP